jgi:hypothetical protein
MFSMCRNSLSSNRTTPSSSSSDLASSSKTKPRQSSTSRSVSSSLTERCTFHTFILLSSAGPIYRLCLLLLLRLLSKLILDCFIPSYRFSPSLDNIVTVRRRDCKTLRQLQKRRKPRSARLSPTFPSLLWPAASYMLIVVLPASFLLLLSSLHFKLRYNKSRTQQRQHPPKRPFSFTRNLDLHDPHDLLVRLSAHPS